jgi:hypothetical protein
MDVHNNNQGENMGYYINPRTQTKEEFLDENGILLTGDLEAKMPDNPDYALVCLVGNGAFTAAGVAYSKRERDAFNDPSDTREKSWYWVPKWKLYPVVKDLTQEIFT